MANLSKEIWGVLAIIALLGGSIGLTITYADADGVWRPSLFAASEADGGG